MQAQGFAQGVREMVASANAAGEPANGELAIALWFANKVRPGGEWDFKQEGSEFEDFGNFHFGVIGAALGYSPETLQRAASLVQNVTDLVAALRGKSTFGTGSPLGGPPYGDQASDQSNIRDGFSAYLLSQNGICLWH
jgi:hypothetical protein